MSFPGAKKSVCQSRRHKRSVGSLGQKDPLEKEMATHSSILAGKSHGQRRATVHGVAESAGLSDLAYSTHIDNKLILREL